MLVKGPFASNGVDAMAFVRTKYQKQDLSPDVQLVLFGTLLGHSDTMNPAYAMKVNMNYTVNCLSVCCVSKEKYRKA